jgi:hypothetical protein
MRSWNNPNVTGMSMALGLNLPGSKIPGGLEENIISNRVIQTHAVDSLTRDSLHVKLSKRKL